MTRHAPILAIVLLAAGCGSNHASSAPDVDIASSGSSRLAIAEPPSIALAGGAVAGSAPGPTTGSRPGASVPVDPISYLAYAYGMRLELPADRLIGVMDGHAAACRGAGLRVCQLVASRRDGDPGDVLQGSLSIRAEPQWLQQFMKGVHSDAAGAAGRVTSQWTTTEDLTREIVDTEATLRAKRALRDRLQQLLATRPGSLADLLGVERELARVQGEIDSTDSTLAAMRTRVAMSALTIEYGSSAGAVAGGTFEPLRFAFGEFLVAVVRSTATLVAVAGALLPWAIAGAIAVWYLIRRRRARRATNPVPPAI